MANAGIAKYAPIGSITEEVYDTLFDTNIKGLVFTVQKALRLMSEGGSIILTAWWLGARAYPQTVSKAPQRPPFALSRGLGRQT